MQLKEIMTQDVEVVAPQATLFEAARRMRELDVGALPVCDGNRLVGMLTDRDLTIRSVAEGRDPRNAQVQDAMSPEVTWCFDDQDSQEAEHVMQEHQIRRLPVVDHDKHLVGIVSLADIATKCNEPAGTARTLEKISEPSAGATHQRK
ncbi:MAG TPA: CBS domain-containing protein [Chthoniobacterales bacterium]